jgi:hypothetical protein
MDNTTIGLALVSAVMLLLPIMALAGRRIPAARLAGFAVMWIVIFGLAWLIMRALEY